MTASRWLACSALVSAALAARCLFMRRTKQSEVEALRAEVAALKEQLAAIAAKVDAVEKKPVAEVKWKGAPETTGEGGWSFKPRGRIHFDTGTVSEPGRIGKPQPGICDPCSSCSSGYGRNHPRESGI